MLEHGVFVGGDLAYLLASASGPSSDLPDWVPAAALVAAAASLAGLLLARLGDRRDRRRTLYSKAYQAALAWEEVYYRVRRRDSDRPHELAARAHEIQEQVNFYEGWIGSESPTLGRAYCRLVLTIKAHTAEPIREAWKQQPSKPEDGFSVEPLRAPEIEAAKNRFISDLRDHLCFNPLRRGALVHRYEDQRWEQIKRQIANKESEDTPCG
jgi:hypothetical protein